MAIDHLKGQIFEQYDTLAKQQGGQGVRVPLAPAVAELQRLAAEPQVRDLHPSLATAALDQAQKWSTLGSYSPKEMQNVIQHLNEQLSGLLKNPTKETYSHNTMMGQVLNTLRSSLNQAMTEGLQGPQYQALRNRYAALASVEGDVANALRKEMGKEPGGLAQKLADPVSWISALHGVAFHDPRTVGLAVAVKTGQAINRYLRSPNRAVTQLFNQRESSRLPSITDRLSAATGMRIGDIRQQLYDTGRITARPSLEGFVGQPPP